MHRGEAQGSRSVKVYESQLWPYLRETAYLVISTEEILLENVIFVQSKLSKRM